MREKAQRRAPSHCCILLLAAVLVVCTSIVITLANSRNDSYQLPNWLVSCICAANSTANSEPVCSLCLLPLRLPSPSFQTLLQFQSLHRLLHGCKLGVLALLRSFSLSLSSSIRCSSLLSSLFRSLSLPSRICVENAAVMLCFVGMMNGLLAKLEHTRS